MLSLKKLEEIIFEGKKDGLNEDQVVSNLINQGLLSKENMEKIEQEKINKQAKFINYYEVIKEKENGGRNKDIAKKYGVNANYLAQLFRKKPEELNLDENGNLFKKEYNRDKLAEERWTPMNMGTYIELKKWSKISNTEIKDIVTLMVDYIKEKELENRILFGRSK